MQGLLCIDNHYHSEICVMCYLTEDFELIEEQTIDIDSIEELDTYPHADTYDWEDVENNIKTTNILIQAVKHLNKEIQSIKDKE